MKGLKHKSPNDYYMDKLITSTTHGNTDLVIKNLLLQLEKDNNIKIIFAVESGSRVWGMDSKDSDYDIRGVYLDLNPIKRNNLILHSKSNMIDGFSDDRNHDWVLWELSTFLKFLKSSNSTAIDWVLSDMVYINNSELITIREEFLKLCNIDFYLFHHYGLLKSMYEKYVYPARKTKQFINDKSILTKLEGVKIDVDFIKQSNTNYSDNIIERIINNLQLIKELTNKTYPENAAKKPTTIKKLLYVCRSALSIEYIFQTNKFPPLNLNIMLEDDNLKLDFDKQLIKDLITIKRKGKEADSYLCPEWIIDWYHTIDTKMKKQYYKKSSTKKITLSDDVFVKYYLSCINKYIV